MLASETSRVMERKMKKIKRTRIVIRHTETFNTSAIDPGDPDTEKCPLCHTVLEGRAVRQIQQLDDRYLLGNGNADGA